VYVRLRVSCLFPVMSAVMSAVVSVRTHAFVFPPHHHQTAYTLAPTHNKSISYDQNNNQIKKPSRLMGRSCTAAIGADFTCAALLFSSPLSCAVVCSPSSFLCVHRCRCRRRSSNRLYSHSPSIRYALVSCVGRTSVVHCPSDSSPPSPRLLCLRLCLCLCLCVFRCGKRFAMSILSFWSV
jgi:hypothetical protein